MLTSSFLFAYEDCAQIIRVIGKIYKQLAPTISTEELTIFPKLLWEETKPIMTDSVSKNLQTANGVTTVLQSSHISYHLLCMSHPVEAFDCSNIVC